MKIKDYKCKCGCDDFFFADKGNQNGIYCSYCGKWFKWADKDEQNLRMKQESILDKIKREISMTNGCGDFIATYDVQKLIDKYISELKGEQE